MFIIISSGYYNQHISNARSTFFGAFFVNLISPLPSRVPKVGEKAREVPSGLIMLQREVHPVESVSYTHLTLPTKRIV